MLESRATICPESPALAQVSGNSAGSALARTACLLLLAGSAAAADRWVTDALQVDMRRGESLQHAIVSMVPAGTRVELLREAGDSGYAQVRLPGGQEGWILKRFLVAAPPARTTMPAVAARLADLEAVNEQLRKTRAELADAQRAANSLGSELEQVRRVSASAIAVADENTELKRRVAGAEKALAAMTEARDSLESRSGRNWFLAGAAAVLAGVMVGLLLPRIRLRRRSSWERF